ncbi:hypothetical protein AF335_14235 [Streptomyces eurocidicus]|uniref:Uncharacterized protein n=1 Tax=Streptomyces eurocidicus TaxID=66423 RepID=A0A2N8NVG5_STREU|nr:hypothetical protein [Streptomyces eurocidicus]MBB5122991.1 hypothetical protein [Streptomyces eurocidicus]MBF6056560.1 hypothetical protein [Streptomyces eurocidicus]PNE32722.1 hypothetical protein AF335_14235 [Streptomyces eurocidicus]
MSTHPSSRRGRATAIVALAAALTTGAAVLTAPQAAAATVSVGYTCTGPGAPAGVQPVQISVTAPASVPAGGTAELSVDVATSIKAPLTLPARSVTGELVIDLGGAASGSVTATGFTNRAVVPSGTAVKVTGGKATVRLGKPGTATFAPGKASVHVFGATAECVVSGTAPVAATTEVTAR